LIHAPEGSDVDGVPEIPAHIDVKVVENSDDTVHITLPVANESDDLSDDDLSSAAGGECDLFMTFQSWVDVIDAHLPQTLLKQQPHMDGVWKDFLALERDDILAPGNPQAETR